MLCVDCSDSHGCSDFSTSLQKCFARLHIINPRRACAARVTVLNLSVCL